MKLLERARELAAQTPPQRNRFVDFLRAASIIVVLFGHWMMAVFTVDEGRIVVRNVLAEAPWTQAFTWLFQVMPIFFIVGGFSNAASWSAAAKSGKSYADWLRSRCQRLLGPTTVYALAWVPIVLLARQVVPDTEVLLTATRLVTVPLWFLAVYLFVVPLAPAMYALHRRFGFGVPLLLFVSTAAVDFVAQRDYVAGQLPQPSWDWINYALVWLAIHQLGYLWHEGRLDRLPSLGWWLTLGGLAGMVSLTFSGLYPISMIGVPGMPTNNTPPTLVLLFLAAVQMGLILLLSPWARRYLAGVEPWARTILANGTIMTMYLWHLTAMVFVVFAGAKMGVGFRLEPLTVGWWLTRVVWLAVLVLVLTIFVALFGRFERPRTAPTPARGRWSGTIAFTGAMTAGIGLAGLAVQGFYTPGDHWGVPLGTLGALVLGALAVGIRPRIYLKPRATES